MRSKSLFVLVLAVVIFAMMAEDAGATKRRRRRRYSGPPPTHPVLLWARTVSESNDQEQRRKAAFKLGNYSQTIFQDEAVRTLAKCIKDPDVEIKVLCTKAMGKAGTQSHSASIRQALLEQYQNDPTIRSTIVRAFMVRKDATPAVQDAFLATFKTSKDLEEKLVILSYFEVYGTPSRITDPLVEAYKTADNVKLKSAIVSALSVRAEGQDSVIALLSQCVENHDSTETPLVLTCLSGLQQQAKKDNRAWSAVEKTIASEDPDVLYATLDVISALPETPNQKISDRLVKLIGEIEEADTLEKAVLSLGVCGTGDEVIVGVLQGVLEKREVGEGVKIAAALVLGKQGVQFPDKSKASLAKCGKEAKSQSLKTACQLGLSEIEQRTITSKQP